ncbi:MAG TPA: O-antigen ligase family protein [Thermoanaerobaculia bacterium]|nr:O-antigen ligase family protein [Thermoanaerobaculia bacterium]
MPARPLLPAALAALFAGWCGTFARGVAWEAAAISQALLLVVLAAGGAAFPDPLRLGRWGRWLPPALWAIAAASLAASPLARVGRVGVLLLPAYLVLPAVVERCWRGERAARWGARALAVIVGGGAIWSLLAWRVGLSPRPAEPLGHHGLLAAWLAILLPLACLPILERGAWRWLGWVGGGLALIAIFNSRSLAAWVAVAVQGAVLVWVCRRRLGVRRVALGAAIAGIPLLLAVPRVLRVLAGADPSARARATYWQAGWEGFLARPLLGWGPGATPWTVARFFDPMPGVNPPGEAVGELHSLPLQLLYELGIFGALAAAALVAVFAVRRARDLRGERSPLAAAGLLGLLGAGVCALASAAVTVTALPLAAVLAAGAALTAARQPAPRRALAWPAPLYAALACALLVPLALAHRHYDRAARAGALRPLRAELSQAVRWDPKFPLYRARLAAHHEPTLAGRLAAADEALRAARDADSVAALWVQAAALGAQARRPWAAEALARARALDPLQPLPQDGPLSGIEAGAETSGPGSFSLYLFRRRPWPAPLVRLPAPISADAAENPAGNDASRGGNPRQDNALQQFAQVVVQPP